MKNPAIFQMLGAARVTCHGNPAENIRRNDWPWCTVEYIAAGQGVLQTNGFDCRPQQGDVYILHRNSRHHYYPDPDDPWEKIFFCVNGRLVDQLWTLYGLSETHYFRQCAIEDLILEMLSPDSSKEILFHRIVRALFACHQQEAAPVPAALREAKDLLDEHIEAELGLADICGAVGLSEAHLSRSFKAAFGQSPYDYLLNRRMEQARFLLSNTTLRVKEIAARLCFADSSHFSNAFKRRVGASPTAYREQL